MNSTWGPGYWRSYRRDEPAEWCMLCGTKVGASRLIKSDVQGLRGAYVCDLHPNERKVRLNPSFVDLGGVGQDPTPVPNWYPHSGIDGFNSLSAETADRINTTNGIDIDVPLLTFNVEASKLYAIKVDGNVSGLLGHAYNIGIGGTATATTFQGTAVSVAASVSQALTGIGDLANFGSGGIGTQDIALNVTVRIATAGTLTTLYSTTDTTLLTGCVMRVGEVDA